MTDAAATARLSATQVVSTLIQISACVPQNSAECGASFDAEHVHAVPFYWFNTMLKPSSRMHESHWILRQCERFFQESCNAPGCHRDRPLMRWRARRALRIENTWLWEAYCHKKHEI